MYNKNIDPARTFDEKTLTWLYELCSQVKAAIRHRYSGLQALNTKLANLGDTCNGRITWRDKDNTPKMIVLHTVEKSCPLHGQPGQGERIRFYVGTDPTKQARANQAIRNEEKRARLQREHNELANKLHAAGYTLCEFYRTLDYPAPKFSETEPAI